MGSKYVDEERGQGRYQYDRLVKARVSSNPTSETDSAARDSECEQQNLTLGYTP